MDYNSIAVLYKTDPAILALRKEWLPLAVSFLRYAFKRKHTVLLPQDVFCEQLDTYIEHVNATLSEDSQYRHNSDYYMDRWSRDDDLIRIRSYNDNYAIQLSPHAERLIGWFEDLQSRGMIGTESRLRNILSLLDEVIKRSTEDVDVRLQQLYDQRDQIEAEIVRVEETRRVDGLSDVQIRERLDHINGMANQLLRDFSLVEERFREMARAIQQAQLNPDARRGDILGTALDADEQLEESDEGQSFRAFYELLTHPEQRNRFDTLIGALLSTPRLVALLGENMLLQRLTSYLLDSGEHVNRSNQRLAEHLRRVVDTRNVTESRRVQALAREIKHMVSQLDDDLIPLMYMRHTFYEIIGDPNADLPLERPLFGPPERIEAAQRPRSASTLIDSGALAALYDTFYIDDTLLYENIARLLMSRSEVTLAELVDSYPVTQGMAEIIAYLLIAAREPQHDIDRAVRDTIKLKTPDNEEKNVMIPRIVFRHVQQAAFNHG